MERQTGQEPKVPIGGPPTAVRALPGWESGVARTALSLAENIAWHNRGVLTGVSFQKKGAGWRVIIRAKIKGEHMVFIDFVESYEDGMEFVPYLAERGGLSFKKDRYPPKLD